MYLVLCVIVWFGVTGALMPASPRIVTRCVRPNDDVLLMEHRCGAVGTFEYYFSETSDSKQQIIARTELTLQTINHTLEHHVPNVVFRNGVEMRLQEVTTANAGVYGVIIRKDNTHREYAVQLQVTEDCQENIRTRGLHYWHTQLPMSQAKPQTEENCLTHRLSEEGESLMSSMLNLCPDNYHGDLIDMPIPFGTNNVFFNMSDCIETDPAVLQLLFSTDSQKRKQRKCLISSDKDQTQSTNTDCRNLQIFQDRIHFVTNESHQGIVLHNVSQQHHGIYVWVSDKHDMKNKYSRRAKMYRLRPETKPGKDLLLRGIETTRKVFTQTVSALHLFLEAGILEKMVQLTVVVLSISLVLSSYTVVCELFYNSEQVNTTEIKPLDGLDALDAFFDEDSEKETLEQEETKQTSSNCDLCVSRHKNKTLKELLARLDSITGEDPTDMVLEAIEENPEEDLQEKNENEQKNSDQTVETPLERPNTLDVSPKWQQNLVIRKRIYYNL